MKVSVKRSYTTVYNNPIELNEGDAVFLGKAEEKKEWFGWIWAEKAGKAGWIPEQIVNSEDGKTGIVTEYYTARELNVNEGDIVEVLRELNGWLWVSDSKLNEGWIPKENVSIGINKQ